MRQPLPKATTLKKLAEALDGDYEYMLALCGLAPQRGADEEFELLLHRLEAALKKLPPNLRDVAASLIEALATQPATRRTPPGLGAGEG